MLFSTRPTLKHIRDGRFRIVKRIGKGAFSTVYKVVDKEGNKYALKVLKSLSHIGSPLAREMLERNEMELEYQAQTLVHRHGNIVTLQDMFFSDNNLRCFLLDLHDGGSLDHYITKTTRFWRNDEEIRRVFLQILGAVERCSEMGVTHGDIKPHNILSDKVGENFFLSDFGLSTMILNCNVTGAIGTRMYMAPELALGEQPDVPYDPRKGDVWSLGIVLCQMITGCAPWSDVALDAEYVEYSERGAKFLAETMAVSPVLVPILVEMLAPKPQNRPTVTELKAMIENVPRFHMNAEEFANASKEARWQLRHFARHLRVSLDFPIPEIVPALLYSSDGSASLGMSTVASQESTQGEKGAGLARALRKIILI
ncbi:kinase-like domain-containing protein [Vararia minispora EC-137]|uniref:Kinase-like domain-containing protein n=1 Tax=Vararia minispora EC-137 TaxID=1314806 RepID=A0ACB8QDW1_9AGAM|nr:kinase-like domain-containing protein [Vararia minispora EC-137]